MKKCNDCNIDKDENQYWKKLGKLVAFCKDCGKIRNKINIEKNKDKYYAKNKVYREEHKERINEKQKKLYQKQKEDRLEYAKDKREKIKKDVEENGLSLPDILEKKCTKCKETKSIDMFYVRKTKNCYTEMCKSCKKKDSSEYRKNNREKINLYRKEYRRNNFDSLTHRRIGISLRNRLSSYINSDESKTKIKDELLDCSFDFLKKWFNYNLELDDITFEEYGSVWHIDHVIPCSAFDLEDEKEINQCFHWTNIRPLEKIKNLVKSNHIKWPDIFVQEIRLKKFIKINHIDNTSIQKWIYGALTTAIL
jgi:hypothetical protein